MADNEKLPKSAIPPKMAESVEDESSGTDAFVDFGSMASIDEGASGVIPIDQLPDPSSSPSVISWTQVIRQHQQQPPSFPEGDSVKIDSDSDRDLLARAASQEEHELAPNQVEWDIDQFTPDQTPLIVDDEDSNAISSRSTPRPKDDEDDFISLTEVFSQHVIELPSDAVIPDVSELGKMHDESGSVHEEEITDAMLVGDPSEEENPPVSPRTRPASADDDDDESLDHSSILEMLLSDPGTSSTDVERSQANLVKESPALSAQNLVPDENRTQVPPSNATHPEFHFDVNSRTTQPELLLEGEESPMALPDPNQPKKDTKLVRPGSEWLKDDDDEMYFPIPTPTPRDNDHPEDAVDLYGEAPLDTGISASGSFQVSQEQLDASERRARMIESSSIDLSSSGALASHFEVNLPVDEGPDSGGDSGNALLSSFELDPEQASAAYGMDEIVDMSLPESDPSAQGSVIRRIPELDTQDHIDIEDVLESRRQRRSKDSEIAEPAAAPNRDRRAENDNDEPIPMSARRPRKSSPSTESVNALPPETTGGKKKGGMLVGGILGLLAGALAFGGVWYAKLLPSDPDKLFSDAAGPTTSPAPQQAPPAKDKPIVVAAAATPALGRHLLESGDINKAIETFNQCEKTVPALAGLGQAKWLAYVQTSASKNQALQPNDAKVKEAIADLDAAGAAYSKNPSKETELEAVRAALWRGLIEESLGNFDSAVKIYTQAAQTYKDHAAVFTTAQNRIAALHPSNQNVGRAIAPQEVLIAFMVMLQNPGNDDPAKTEAGFDFWDAVLSANKNNYADAVKAIARAKQTHLKQRDLMAGKGLNPFSDPREQIFERCCNDLTHYWTLCDRLYKDPAIKELASTKGADEAIAALIAGKTTAEKTLSDLAEKVVLKKDQKLPEAVEALIKDQNSLIKQLKDAGVDEPKLEDGLNKILSNKKVVEDKIKDIREALEKAGAKDPDAIKAVAELVAARDSSDALIKSVRQKLAEAKYVEPSAGPKEVVKGVDEAIVRGSSEAVKLLGEQKQEMEASLAKAKEELAKTKEQVVSAKKEIEEAKSKAKADLETQMKKYDAVLLTVKTSAQSLDLWLPALIDASFDADSAAAMVDAERVLNDEATGAEVKVKALAVKALALRKQNKITEAVEAFGLIHKHSGLKDQPWTKEVFAVEAQLKNPTVSTVVPQPTTQQVLQSIEAKMKVFTAEAFPKEHAKLLAQRSLYKLEAQDIVGAAADADAALKAEGGAEAFLAAGRVAERQRKWDEAEKNYQAVIKMEKLGSALWKQAKQGLARILLDRALPPADAPATKEGASLVPTTQPALDAQTASIILVSMLFAPEIPLEIGEALKQGDELIAQQDYLGYILKAKAYALVGKYQEALREYSQGIKLLKVLPKEYENVLDLVIKSHPALQGTGDEDDGPKGEKFYSVGIDEYQSGHYAKAETHFLSAIRQNKRDARFLYYLGLSRLQQGKNKLAEDDFRAGALLELRGVTSMRTINDSLERVQGTAREAIDKFRP